LRAAIVGGKSIRCPIHRGHVSKGIHRKESPKEGMRVEYRVDWGAWIGEYGDRVGPDTKSV